MRHKFLLVTVKEWLKSVLNYQSYPKKTRVSVFLEHPVYFEIMHKVQKKYVRKK